MPALLPMLILDTKLPNWMNALVSGYEYLGCVPKVIIPDGTKTAVITPDLVDHVMNKSYCEMAKHYRTTLVPARASKRRDKALVENMVGHLSRRITAVLINRQFFTYSRLT